MSNKINDKHIEDRIDFAEESGLVFTGEFEDSLPQFIGDDKAWKKFNK